MISNDSRVKINAEEQAPGERFEGWIVDPRKSETAELNVRKQKYCGFSISFICREGERLCAAMKTKKKKKKMQLQRLDRGWMNEGKGERRLKVGKSKVYERIGNVGVLV